MGNNVLNGIVATSILAGGIAVSELSTTGVNNDNLSPDVRANITALSKEFRDRCICLSGNKYNEAVCPGRPLKSIITDRDTELAKDGLKQDLRRGTGGLFDTGNPGWSEGYCTVKENYIVNKIATE